MYKYVQFAFMWAKRTRSSRWWPLSMIIWLHVTSLIYKAAYEFVKTFLYFIYLVIKIVNGLCGGWNPCFVLIDCQTSITFLLYTLYGQEHFFHHYFWEIRITNNNAIKQHFLNVFMSKVEIREYFLTEHSSEVEIIII